MPIMDGFEMLAVMNKNGWIKSVPVIMISAETVPSYMDKAYDLGVLDYISRPFDERVVQRRVTSTIMLAAKQKELAHMVTEQLYEKEKDNRLMIEILSNIVEFRNGESGLHVLHIHTLTELLLKKLIEKTDKYNISKKDAIKFYKENGTLEKAANVNIYDNIVTIYKLKKYLNYYYVNMPYSTKYIKQFDIKYLGDNRIVLLYPSNFTKGRLPEYVHHENII